MDANYCYEHRRTFFSRLGLRSLSLILALITFCGVARGEVSLTAPNGGEEWFAGDVETISWTASGTSYLRIAYSIDGGLTWLDVVPDGSPIPASLGAYTWTVPNTPTASALVRLTDIADPEISDRSDAPFSILQASLRVLSPNGGERYEMAEPVTVTWESQNVTTLRLDYSSDNGATWRTAASGIPAGAGSHTFVPYPMPTRLGLVRLVDLDRPRVQDRSNRPFEIMEARTIILFTPVSGDKLLRGSQTVISWDAQRVAAVDLFFSSDGGATWQTLATNILYPNWSYLWNVPNITTQQGKIRVVESGGTLIGETGLFSIGDEADPVVRVIQPNGGEKFFVGDTAVIWWGAIGATTVSLYYSTDGGSTWTLIVANIPATQSRYRWKIDGPPGTQYRVKVEAGPSVSDISNADFEVARRRAPAMLVEYPNGGERFGVGDTVTIRWNAIDILGGMDLEYSIDSGRTWTDIITVTAAGDGPYTHNWVIPNQPTTVALIRVSNPDAADGSDSVFAIVNPVVLPIRVVVPNGLEVWRMEQRRMVEWEAPAVVTEVDIDFSIDGGATWRNIAMGVPSSTTSKQYEWWIPGLSMETDAARVRVRNSALAEQSDMSDRPFTIRRDVIAGADDGEEANALHLLGSYPNPMADYTEIRWLQHTSADVEIRLHDLHGDRAGIFHTGLRNPGEQRFRLDGAGLAEGMYIYEVRAGDAVVRGRVVVVR